MRPSNPRRLTMRILRIGVAIVKKDDKVLLSFCKRGFNANKFSLLGGVLQPREEMEASILKNVKIQCGLNLENLEKVAKIEVKFAGVQELLQFHVFITESFSGDIKESREGIPQWFTICEVPLEKMWQDMATWLPLVLSGQKVKGYFVYQNEDVIYQELKPNAVFGQRIVPPRSKTPVPTVVQVAA